VREDRTILWKSGRLDGTVPPVNAFSAAPIIRSYDITLPFGVAMTVNSAHWLTRRSNLDVLLTMHPEPEKARVGNVATSMEIQMMTPWG